MEMDIKEAGFLGGGGERSVSFKNFVQPTSSGAGGTDDEERRERAPIGINTMHTEALNSLGPEIRYTVWLQGAHPPAFVCVISQYI